VAFAFLRNPRTIRALADKNLSERTDDNTPAPLWLDGENTQC